MLKSAVKLGSGALCLWLGAAGVTAATLEYRPIPGVSAEPIPPGPAEALTERGPECVRSRRHNIGLSPRPAFSNGLGEPSDLAAVVDDAMCNQFDEAYIAGAVVAIVDGDRIAFSSGYGYADLQNQKRVDPAQTMFRIGSVSKIFAWTAAMQLVDRGASLTTDINAFLNGRVTIPATFDQPVTLKNLMTHTSGFEENIGGIGMAHQVEELPTLEETITKHVPARVRPPATTFAHGEEAAYSNWGAALTGYIVQQQSGESFDDYVERHIFAPLGMAHSSFREPLPTDLARHMSSAYGSAEDYPVCDFQYLHGLGPASSGSASAEDMARFMRAHLSDDSTILQRETKRLMHSRALSPHSHLAGGTYGFNERYINGRRLLWHSGFTGCFYSELYLFPEENIGMFVAYNTPPLNSHMADLARRFMDHYFPAHLPALEPSTDQRSRLVAYAGYYRPTSRAHETWEKIFDLTGAIEISVTDRGTLRAPLIFGTELVAEWVPVPQAPGVLRRIDGEETIALLEVGGERYVLGPWPFAPAVRLHWFETRPFNMGVLGLCVPGFLFAIAFSFARRRNPSWRAYGLAGWLAAAAGAVNLSMLLALGLAWRNPGEIMVALPWPLLAGMGLSLMSALLTFVLVLVVAHGWRQTAWSRQARLGFTVLALPYAAFLWWLCFWNLIGFQLG